MYFVTMTATDMKILIACAILQYSSVIYYFVSLRSTYPSQHFVLRRL
jgi:hypothetical protein